MSKQISIVDIKIKEITLSENDGKYSIGVWYSLVDGEGNEISTKRDLIPDDEIEKTGYGQISDMLSFAKIVIKTREQI